MLKLKKFFIKYKSYIICMTIVLLSSLSIVFQSIDRKEALKVNNENIKDYDGKIAVYITGEVKNPGVYYLDEQSARLYNLLDVCGGILEDADIEKLNLAKKLVDSEKIVITKKLEKQNIEEIEEKIDESEGTYYIDEDDEKININNASKEELMSLNGIGESTANKIIEYRKKNSFVDIEDIMNVDGIGKSKYENIKNHICI
ncbi:competence protein comEA [Clostridium sp. CAG:921]|nr:competence protein comEA [Clostridium sp. CAG:921]